MKKLEKTDRFISMFQEVIDFIIWLPIERIKLDKDRKEEKTFFFKKLIRSYFILKFHLADWMRITVDPNYKIEDVSKKITEKYYSKDPYPEITTEAIAEVLSLPRLTYKDVIDEFWDFSLSIDQLPQVLQVSRVKFKKVLSEIPDLEENSLDKIHSDNKNFYNSEINTLWEQGFLTEKEADFVLNKIHNIIQMVNFTVERLAESFNDFKEMQIVPPKKDSKKYPSLPDCFIDKQFWISLIEDPRIQELYEKDKNGIVKWLGSKVLLAGLAFRLLHKSKLIPIIKSGQDLARIFCPYFSVEYNQEDDRDFTSSRVYTTHAGDEFKWIN